MELNKHSQEQLNDEPVHYCTECLSIRIMNYDENTGYCDECGSTDIKQIHIADWQDMYKERYKVEFLNTKRKK